MAINKMHNTPDGLKRCSAKTRCEYGASEQQHVFIDTSINSSVLNPESPEQQKLNAQSVDELKTAHSDNESIQNAYKDYEKSNTEFTAVVNKLIKNYPAEKQGFAHQLENVKEGDSVNVFEINMPSSDFINTVSDKEKTDYALAWLKMKKAESVVRAHVSAAHVRN